MSISVAKWCEPVETFFVFTNYHRSASLCANYSDADEHRKNSGVFAIILQTFNSLKINEESLVWLREKGLAIFLRHSDRFQSWGEVRTFFVLSFSFPFFSEYFIPVNMNIYIYIYLLSFHEYLYWTMPEKSECLLVGVRQRQGDTRQMGPGCGDRSWGPGGHLSPSTCPHSWVRLKYSICL